MIRRSKFPVSPACHNRVTWLARSVQQLTLLVIVKSKQLCQAPRSWRHNPMPWWRHLQNITGFRNLKLDMLSDVKYMGIYWLNFVFLTSRGKSKTVELRVTVHQISLGESAAGADLRSARRPLIPIGRSDGPYYVTTQFYYFYRVFKSRLHTTECDIPHYLAIVLHVTDWLLNSFVCRKRGSYNWRHVYSVGIKPCDSHSWLSVYDVLAHVAAAG